MQLVLALLASLKLKETNMGKFTRMPKMKTTEPSVDEVKMKKGGKAKKMAMGGDPRMAAMPAQQDPRMMAAMKKRAMMARPPMAAAEQSPMMMRKKGGKADMSQDKALIKKAFKQHDMQEHKGGKGTSLKLKKGGMKKFATGGVINGQGGYKDGGMPMVEKDGKSVPAFAADGKGKMKTGGVIRGYKDGGHVAMACKAEGGYTTMKKMAKC
jgi:hypothetical protein